MRKLRPASVMQFSLLVLWGIFCLFPLAWLAITSFKGEAAIMEGPTYLPFIDFTPTLESWVVVLSDPYDNLLTSYGNSVLVSLLATALTMVVACLSVYALTRLQFGNAFGTSFLALVFSTRILPPAAIALPIYLLAQKSGTLDTYFALITTYAAINLPLAVWLLLPVFGPRASQQEESALLEGASHARVLMEILLPMTLSGVVAAGFLVFVQCWNEYYLAVHLAGDRSMTLPPFLVGQMSIKEAQVGGDGDEWPQFSAATMIAVIPLLAATGFAQAALSRVARWRG